MRIKIKHISVAIILLGLTAVAHATAEGGYFGLQVGNTNTHNKSRTVVGNGTPPRTAVVKPSSTGIGERIFGGFNFSQYAALEMGITHYTNANFNTSSSVTCNSPSIQQNAFDIEGKGMLPVWKVTVYGKAGLAVLRQKYSGSLTGSSIISPCGGGHSATVTTNARPLVGLGISYDITQSWVADVSWTRILPGSNTQAADFVGVGIAYHIVDKKCGQFLC